MKSFLFILVLVLTAGVCLGASPPKDFGIESMYEDEEMISLATGRSMKQHEAPAVSTVITAKDIREMGARNLNEILETVPGLHIGRSATIRLDSVYSIRGIQTNRNPHVLVMLNGVAINVGSTGGRPVLFQMPSASIERVEIIRGPGSAIYGADAFSGVVNIVTKSADTIDSSAGVRAGSFGVRDAWINAGHVVGDLKLSISVEGQKSDGDDGRVINRDYQTLVDSMVGTSASLAPGPLSTGYEMLDTHIEANWKDWTLRGWNWRLKDAGLGAGAALALDPEGTQNENIYLTELAYENDHIAGWEFDINGYYYYYKSDGYAVLQPPGTTLPVTVGGVPMLVAYPDGLIAEPGGTGKLLGTDASTVYSKVEDHHFRVGAGYRRLWQDITYSKNFGEGVVQGVLTDVTDTEYAYMPNVARTVWYLSFQDEWQLASDWQLTSGIRFDHYSDVGSTYNPRIALVWLTSHNLTTKLMYGRAFRAPSFQELFATANPVDLGNPDLDPEEIDTVELVFDYRPTLDVQTVFSLFSYKADGLIESLPSGPSSRTAENSRDIKGYGLEFECSWNATRSLRLNGNYSWQKSEDEDTGQRLAGSPEHQAYAQVHWTFFPEWSLNTQVFWIGKRYRELGDTREKADDYTTVNLTLSKTNILKNLNFKVAARNLFDEDIREPSDGTQITEDFPMEGRSLWAELSYDF